MPPEGSPNNQGGQEMSDKEVVLAVFDDEAAADAAVKQVTSWDKASDEIKLSSIGVLVMDDKGKIKTNKMGARSTGKGAGIGLILVMLTPVGLVTGAVGGALLGRLHRKGLGLSESDRDRISGELEQGHAVVGVLAPTDQAPMIKDKLTELGGDAEAHDTDEAALEEAAKEVPSEATSA
jgi:uncharacterized membrane protein